jgi:predicted phage tail protein
MLTEVILEGPLGKAFGRKWKFAISSPAEALRMVNANKPGVFIWIRQNLDKYARYRVICEYDKGRTEELDADEYKSIQGSPKRIRFVPLIEGAGAAARFIVGAVLVIVGLFTEIFSAGTSTQLVIAGAAMMIGSLVEMLSPHPKKKDASANAQNAGSYYFNGAVNTTEQGVPVQLVYGQMVVGSHAISANVSVDQLM